MGVTGSFQRTRRGPARYSHAHSAIAILLEICIGRKGAPRSGQEKRLSEAQGVGEGRCYLRISCRCVTFTARVLCHVMASGGVIGAGRWKATDGGFGKSPEGLPWGSSTGPRPDS